MKKLQRAHFIAFKWGTADSPHPGQDMDPLNYGWKDKNGIYIPDWFSGPAIPDDLFKEDDLMGEPDNDSEEEDIDFHGDDVNTGESWTDDSESEPDI